MIKDAPLAENACRRLADLVGFIKKTSYGEEFMVKTREETTSYAYLPLDFQLHTDIPYQEYTPGVILLHCLVQTSSPGGFNLMVDGFFVVEKLKVEYPNFYRILTTTLVNWCDYGAEDGNKFQKIYRAPVIW